MQKPRPVLGILGGLGPLASAEFLRALYQRHTLASEQEMPRCILISDPTFPDRTRALLEGRQDELAERLVQPLADLVRMGADTLLIACITAHSVLDSLVPVLRDRVVSLVDLAISEQIARPQRRLLLTTLGTRSARIFERHPRWPMVAACMIPLDERDQTDLHDWIYRLKRGESPEDCGAWLRPLADRYQVSGFVFGCTELHLLHSVVNTEESVDPLAIVIRDLHTLERMRLQPLEPILDPERSDG